MFPVGSFLKRYADDTLKFHLLLCFPVNFLAPRPPPDGFGLRASRDPSLQSILRPSSWLISTGLCAPACVPTCVPALSSLVGFDENIAIRIRRGVRKPMRATFFCERESGRPTPTPHRLSPTHQCWNCVTLHRKDAESPAGPPRSVYEEDERMSLSFKRTVNGATRSLPLSI